MSFSESSADRQIDRPTGVRTTNVAMQQEISGEGFTALYQNVLETQVATLALRFRF